MTCELPDRVAGAGQAAEMRAVDGLVNATPVGRHHYPGMAFPKAGFVNQRWAFDAVNTPKNTGFLETCRRRGIETISGFKWFLYQGFNAFYCFTGIEVGAPEAERACFRRYPPEGWRFAE